jgi:aspartyl-tRNA(Asn)/glutamyl-tRNA(Gln) amidotransferase subunit A
MFSISKNPTISEVQALYKDQKATPTQVVHFFLNRSKQVDKEIKAILRYTESLANDEAEVCDQLLVEYREERGDTWFEELIQDYPLFGVPYSLKDNILVEGEIVAAASKILQDYRATYSATVYLKLKEAGAILIFQSNMDEFAMGSSTENSALQKTKNPYDLERVPGGSSGGPAAAVASGQAVFSLGSDTGGSIRLPAAFCNLVGIKPTYGLVSRYGTIAMASSLDQIGAFTNTVQDNLLVLQALAGQDAHDSTSLPTNQIKAELDSLLNYIQEKASATRKVVKTDQPMKIGLIKELFGEGVDPVIRAKVKEAAKTLESYGHELVDLELPLTKYGLAVYYTTMTVEASSNLERYDAIRYAGGILEEAATSELFFSARNAGFGQEPKRRTMLGTFASSSGFYEAYYSSAEKVTLLLQQQFQKAFDEVDLILIPTAPEFPFKIGEKSNDPLSMYLSDIMTISVNITRIVGLNVPLGLVPYSTKSSQVDSVNTSDNAGLRLPVGCQVLGPELSEPKVYKLALEIQQFNQK